MISSSSSLSSGFGGEGHRTSFRTAAAGGLIGAYQLLIPRFPASVEQCGPSTYLQNRGLRSVFHFELPAAESGLEVNGLETGCSCCISDPSNLESG